MVNQTPVSSVATSETVSSKNGAAVENPSSLHLEVYTTDADVIRAVGKHLPGESRDQYIANALRLGVMALESLAGEVDAMRVKSEVDRMLTNLQSGLDSHTRLLDQKLENSLKTYFDPKDGKLHNRLEQLIKQGGDMDLLIHGLIGDEQSELAKTLAQHVGEKSPLFKVLDPEKSKGLLGQITKTLEVALAAQGETVLKEFSMDNKKGALKRFIVELTESQGKLTSGMEEQIDGLVKEFSLDKDGSALSRLMKLVKESQRKITDEFSLDTQGSALCKLRKELTGLLEAQDKAANEFRESVQETLAGLKSAKEERQKGTQHGLDFEDSVVSLLGALTIGSDIQVHATGNKTGAIKSCKKGDVVLELGPEHIAAGVNIVFEAKQKKGYDMAAAMAEIAEARKNRQAQIGVFVFSAMHAPDGIESFKRMGDDIYVVWDESDPSTDVYMAAALSVSLALCSKQANSNHAAFEYDLVNSAILEIERRASDLCSITTWTNTISNNADKILAQIKTSRKAILNQVAILNEQVVA